MPEHKQIRALLAVCDLQAGSALRALFRARGDRAEIVHPEDLAAEVRASVPHLVLLQLHVPGGPLAVLQREFPDLPVVVLVPPQPAIAFYAAKCGAAEMLTLPLNSAEAARRLRPVLDGLNEGMPPHGGNGRYPESGSHSGQAEQTEGARPADIERTDAEPVPTLPGLFSTSPRMAAVRFTIDRVASTSATVLIRGESGVGKEVVARTIFARSDRSRRPFVKVNCAAIPHDLLESELFGYDAGAFTGANRSRPGKFELANGGTLFLDEIAEMHPALQAKLLHVLQDGEFARLGARRDTAVDVRVLCATNKLLEQRIGEGLFREDLFYRINVVTIHIPPLRERRDEIPVLLRHFIEKYAAVYRRCVVIPGDEVMQQLAAYSWPGNIRELENLCKRYVIVGDATQIVRELAQHHLRRGAVESPASPPVDLPIPAVESLPNGEPALLPALAEPSLLEIGRRAAWQAERQAIEEMLVETRWNRREAARRLRVSYKALLNKIQQIEKESPARSEHLEA
ncbi:sigma-54 interaction domain-containing protein [Paracidobacterium acidisoli]|uniref:Sigma-54-dependent Fis family transcriptional regulator n=1 Tax=Paracidobacterium acidisoli TaxID=2303751 RepID=A0A372IUZ9_9BACT|nr:sigma-54 dependent transcriptional regulator [Paracidobacterium acidisoli]MBT9330081.1 sigma-54 dependent transcriptional regulator [Paracidobacterium acidisoli]